LCQNDFESSSVLLWELKFFQLSASFFKYITNK
jgi:hypothetical protein